MCHLLIALVTMEEIRGMFRAALLDEVDLALRDHEDIHGHGIRDELFDHLAGMVGVDSWPPPFHSSGGCSLSSIIRAFQTLEPWSAGCCEDCLNEMQIQQIGLTCEKQTVGLCLRCVREDSLALAWDFEDGAPVFHQNLCGHDYDAAGGAVQDVA